MNYIETCYQLLWTLKFCTRGESLDHLSDCSHLLRDCCMLWGITNVIRFLTVYQLCTFFPGSIHNILSAFYFIVSADSYMHKCKYRHTYSLCCGSNLEQSVALLLWCLYGCCTTQGQYAVICLPWAEHVPGTEIHWRLWVLLRNSALPKQNAYTFFFLCTCDILLWW
jgi:hypothetical protein